MSTGRVHTYTLYERFRMATKVRHQSRNKAQLLICCCCCYPCKTTKDNTLDHSPLYAIFSTTTTNYTSMEIFISKLKLFIKNRMYEHWDYPFRTTIPIFWHQFAPLGQPPPRPLTNQYNMAKNLIDKINIYAKNQYKGGIISQILTLLGL